jgi:hypothetical protein
MLCYYSIDVTGTLMVYKGELSDYYCIAEKAFRCPCPEYTRMHEGLKFSHKDMANKYPRVFWVFSQNAIHCVVKNLCISQT